MRIGVLVCGLVLGCWLPLLAQTQVMAQAVPPKTPLLKAPIQNPAGQPMGEAHVYFNYVELFAPDGKLQGAIGVVMQEGRARLFVVGGDEARPLLGWAENQRVYDANGRLVGYYAHTPTWSYVYTPARKKVGQAQCLAYQGVCAAGVAGYLLGLLAPPAPAGEALPAP